MRITWRHRRGCQDMNESHQIMSSEEREYDRVLNQERLKEEVSQAIFELMNKEGISRAELASRMGKNKAWISRVLSGGHNFQLHTLADVFYSLGRGVHIYLDRNCNTAEVVMDASDWNMIDASSLVKIRGSSPRRHSPTTSLKFTEFPISSMNIDSLERDGNSNLSGAA